MTALDLIPMNEAEKMLCLSMVGAATARLQNDAALTDKDRSDLTELVGLFASNAHMQFIAKWMDGVFKQMHLLELQLAALQRQNVERLS
jgi:hypothetical protein